MRAYCDGACRISNPGQCSAAFVVYDSWASVWEGSRYLGPELHTNNYAEYQGLLDLLKWAEACNLKGLDIHCDSQLVVKQVRGEWAVKHKELQPLHDLAQALIVLGRHNLCWIRGHEQAELEEDRLGNTYVDKLCNIILDREIGEKK